ncbi:MAG: hypothetical protein U9Q38_07970 [Thermodesulfobacteriota bacterium]|nr:hypothetical protein [Thermodesulfobacteriota bacterium]
MVKMNSSESFVQEEAEWIEESGETPEVAFYEAVFYLTEKEDGPKLTLSPSDIKLLEDAVIYRYKIIILRDLDYTNTKSPVFRGMKRAIINYERLKKYQSRKNRVVSGRKEKTGLSLVEYMDRECRAISKGRLYRTINCGRIELEKFSKELGVDIDPECLNMCFKQVSLTFDEVYLAALLTERDDYPYKFLYDREDCFEIVIFNEDKEQLSTSLKICMDEGTNRQNMRLKADAIYRSIPKSAAPWKTMGSI